MSTQTLNPPAWWVLAAIDYIIYMLDPHVTSSSLLKEYITTHCSAADHILILFL